MHATATDTISALAETAASYFAERERPDGSTYRILRDDRPEWLYELVRAAHGDFLPDDWRYARIEEALEAIALAGNNELEDVEHEFADGAVDVYTGDRLAWLGSNLQRSGYCDEAQAEGLAGEDADLVGRVGLGQYVEAREIFGLVLDALREHAGGDR